MEPRTGPPQVTRAFRFDPVTRRQLRSTLGAAANVVLPELEIVVGRSRGRPIPDGLRPYATRQSAEILALIRTLAAFVGAIGTIPDLTKESLATPSLGTLLFGERRYPTKLERLTAMRAQALVLLKELGPSKRPAKRGRPMDEMRHLLALEVALLLRHCGVPVAKSRDGEFGSVLAIAFAAVDEDHVPGELFRYIKRAADDVREMTPGYFRWLVRKAFTNSEFWAIHLVR